MPNYNIGRLSEDIKREVSTAMRDLKDKRVSSGVISISHCEVTSDLSYCRLYVSALGGTEKTEEAVACLTSAEGFFKKRINARIRVRKMPELVFLPDNSQEYYEHISEILDSLPKKVDKDINNEQ